MPGRKLFLRIWGSEAFLSPSYGTYTAEILWSAQERELTLTLLVSGPNALCGRKKARAGADSIFDLVKLCIDI